MPTADEMNSWLQQGLEKQGLAFKEAFLWMQQHMPASFFEELDHENIYLIVQSLTSLHLQDFFSCITSKQNAYVLSLDGPEADLTVLKQFKHRGIKNYRTYISSSPPSFLGAKAPVRITMIGFTKITLEQESIDALLPKSAQHALFEQLQAKNPDVNQKDFDNLLKQLNPRFLRAFSGERLIVALDMFFRAKRRDNCQYEIKLNKNWQESKEIPSLQIVFAWRNVPKSHFLYRLAKIIHRHSLQLKKVNAIYIDPQSRQNILIMSVALHGKNGKAAWDEADLEDFLRELVTVKYFEGMSGIEKTFVDTKLLTGNEGNLIKSMTYFLHQALVHADPNMYTLEQIAEDLCRHPDLTCDIIHAFHLKFDPQKNNIEKYHILKKAIATTLDKLDTGNTTNDERRKNVLRQAINFIEHTLKTNYYRNNKTAHSFRLNPYYLDYLPYDRREKFPEIPYGIFFMKGYHFIGFHIRFKDLSRGGLRTVVPEKNEQMIAERNTIFSECYNLAYTQQKKNKEIPEGGAKGVILVEPHSMAHAEATIYQTELVDAAAAEEKTLELIEEFTKQAKLEHMYQAQRSYIESFITLLNCDDNGKLKAKNILDYLEKPEYIYLGPDENMHNTMIEWIANYSKYYGYKPQGAFISSKPSLGINHKEYGVTSLGVNVYMEEVLRYLGIDAKHEPFTIKMSGGPDGDVAGNQMANLAKHHPSTAKLLTTIDVSGTIFDPQGLDLATILSLFQEQKPIRFYPKEKLSEGGFLLDTKTKRQESTFAWQTLCWKNVGGKIIETWVSGSEMNHILRHTVHKTVAEIFIPGGGRPRTLNENNIEDFLTADKTPTAKAIVEGANLYLTPKARSYLEELGVLIIKDSSANKGGVTCSSFEVLSSLCLSEEEFLKEKPHLVPQILEIIKAQARDEARLLLHTHQETKRPLTEISEELSTKINTFVYELLDHLERQTLSNDPSCPLIQALIHYCPPLLREKYCDRILTRVPDIHKKAIIACHIGSRLVYHKGLYWTPKIADILPIITQDPHVIGALI